MSGVGGEGVCMSGVGDEGAWMEWVVGVATLMAVSSSAMEGDWVFLLNNC